MPEQTLDAGRHDCCGIHVNSSWSPNGGSPADPESLPTATKISVPFKLVAEFRVEAEDAAEYLQQPDLDPQERSLFLAIITTPEALNRICRLAVVCALTEDSERVFKGLFMGPDSKEIFESILPYLPVEIEEYWTKLRREDINRFDAYICHIFEQFRSSLRKTEMIDMATGESIPLWVNSRIHPGDPPGHLFFE